ncbi:MAG: AmmeMemoRadiSam system protein A [Clostridiales Family XIII bacterium]|jgi:AmmeMemoRadiSam system protein A|nr:AmmeMemoRadiSam system protein A [Clostridiales Family XIII bacterium]
MKSESLQAYLVPHPPLIVPEVGGKREIPITRAAYGKVAAEIAALKPDTLVIFSPHSILYADYFHISPGKSASGDFGQFRAQQVKISVEYDAELAALIGDLAQADGIAAGSLGERDSKLDHGVMVPLYFFKAPSVVRIGLSGFSLETHYRFGMCVRKAIERLGRGAAIIASGDMSHKLKADGPYGFDPAGPVHDEFVKECLERGDFRKLLTIDPSLAEAAAECGLRSIIMLAGAMDGCDITSEVYSYEGPYGVGYLTAAVRGGGRRASLLPDIIADKKAKLAALRDAEDEFVRLARQNVEHFVKTGKTIAPPGNLPPGLTERRAGVFVSIKKNGDLRGCIGTIAPICDSIALEIIQNGVSAASHDSRFEPIAPDELEELTYSVDVLAEPEPIADKSQLDVKRYGVIVTHGRKRGLLLPNLEGVDTVEQQISIALQKGGIRGSEPYTIERFEVVRHK